MVTFAGRECGALSEGSAGSSGAARAWDMQGLSVFDVTSLVDAFFGLGLEQRNSRVLVLPFSALPFYGTAKSLTAYAMVCEALRDGKLAAGRIVVEPTSGNTGLALAEILNGLGFPFIMVVSRKISPAFEEELSRRFGAKTISLDDPTSLEPVFAFIESRGGRPFTLLVKLPSNYCPTDEPSGAIAYAKRLVEKSGGRIVMLDQYDNPANPRIHREVTAPSIMKGAGCLLDGRRLQVFLSGGTFGTALGLAQFFVDNHVDAKLVVVLPRGEDVFGVVDHENAKRRRFYRELVALAEKSGRQDLFEIVEVDEPMKKVSEIWGFNQTLRKANSRVDLTGGYSSMLVLWAATQHARNLSDTVMVLLFHDSSKMYAEPKPQQRPMFGDEFALEPELAKKMVLEEGARLLYVYPIPVPVPDEVRSTIKRRLSELLGAQIADQDIKNIEEVIEIDELAALGEAKLKKEFYAQVKADPRPLILVCPHGGTSSIVASKLRQLGVEDAYSLKGGVDPAHEA